MGVKPISVPQPLAYAIDSAGAKSDVDFDYLLQTAIRESSLNPEAKAPTSTATGLYQFLDSTWLQVMKEQGPRLGYQQYAAAIEVNAEGDYYVADKAMRKQVLALREDPQVSSDLAAAYTRSNGEYLFAKFGRMPSAGELYIAHFLGAQGAEKLFNAGLSNPDQIAAKLFPKQAQANRSIFYENGKARTIREVYEALVDKHQAPANPLFTAQQLAADPGKWPNETPVPSRFSTDDMSFTSLFSNEGEVQGRVLMSPSSESQGNALFTQLYGQGK
jgi:hypothetical protein